jgi:hypothetical protein
MDESSAWSIELSGYRIINRGAVFQQVICRKQLLMYDANLINGAAKFFGFIASVGPQAMRSTPDRPDGRIFGPIGEAPLARSEMSCETTVTDRTRAVWQNRNRQQEQTIKKR